MDQSISVAGILVRFSNVLDSVVFIEKRIGAMRRAL